MNQKLIWLKEIEGKTLGTLSRNRKFKIEKVDSNNIQLRFGKNMDKFQNISNDVIYKNDEILINKKELAINDIENSPSPSLRSYVISILAFRHKEWANIDFDPVSKILLNDADLYFKYEYGRGLTPEELNKILAAHHETGLKAESIVIDYERDKLKKYKLNHLIDKIKWVSKKDCTEGYDILSFDEEGRQIYIEVKGTVYETSDSFKLTRNELNRAKLEGEKYYIYHVKNVNSGNPTLLILPNPFQLIEEKEIRTDPSEYVVGYPIERFNRKIL